MLTVGAYHEAGGVRDAIARHAERTLARLPRRDRAIARAIFLSLTDVADGAAPTRRRAGRADIAASNVPARRERVLDALAAARLVTVDEETVTVSHEALIRHWPRLRAWIDADRAGLLIHRRLRDAASQWDALGRETTALYRGASMAAARAWASEHDDLLSQPERDFLIASSSHERSVHRSAMRRTRRLRMLCVALAAVAIIVATLTVSDDQRLHRRARARGDPHLTGSDISLRACARLAAGRSLLFALAALRASPGVTARGSVLAALAALSRRHTLPRYH